MLAPLLGKLHVSPASTESLFREVYQEASVAIEDKLISDAAGRNALYKIHVSLGKIVNNMTEKGTKGRKGSVALTEDKLDDEESDEKTEIVKVDDDEGTVLGNGEDESSLPKDSVVDKLICDDDATMK